MLDIHMYTPEYKRRGVLPWVSASVKLRNNDVSTFTVEVDGTDPRVQRVEEGWRLVFYDDTDQMIAGHIDKVGISSDAGVRTLTFSGVNDIAWLENMITLPEPDKAPASQDTSKTFKRKGDPAEKTMHTLVRQLVAQDALPAYRRDHARLENPTGPVGDDWVGKPVEVNTAFEPVIDVMQTLAEVGEVNFKSFQDDDVTVFSFYEGVDRSRYARLFERNGGVSSYTIEHSAPTVTDALVAGSAKDGSTGEEADGKPRKLFLRSGNANDWAFKALVFDDQSSEEDDDNLKQSGDEALIEGQAKGTFDVEINETPKLRFRTHYDLGDTITILLENEVPVSDILQIVEIDWGSTGRTAKVTIGPALEDPEETEVEKQVRKLMRELNRLQRRR